MRFIPSGPWLPDELLTARDAGEVLFFCGAGISQADANLPNFAVLAERVLTLLGSAMDSPARRLFNAAREFEKASGLTGLVATDRIFGMLEREFEAAEVRTAVSTALRPEPGYVLDAHRTLLDLSRIHGGAPRLVTTNFDLLFEECEPGIESFNRPHLPDPGRAGDFRGIIHLHGRVDEQYSRACDDEFVLSSADFGHAYLSDGWATRYIQALLQRFRIVFVGYSADDPPVQYLLEALNRFARPAHALYAFQSGDSRQAAEQWVHKGVEPISYDSADKHAALWTTLSAWAERARNVGGWYDELLERAASQGPESMAPHERGMIAHLAATSAGAKSIANSTSVLPADWLFVFDRNARYGRPGKTGPEESQPPFDPFDAYGLDSDLSPPPSNPSDVLAKRSPPESAWDGMQLSSTDMEGLTEEAISHLRNSAAREPVLPGRLADLGWWLVKVAHQPAALWWAAGQPPLHSQIRVAIERSLRLEATRYAPEIRRGWRLLLLSWQRKPRQPDLDKYSIEDVAKRDGWSFSLVREAIELYQPYLSAERSFFVRAPASTVKHTLDSVLRLSVAYPRPHEPFALPNELLEYAITVFRRQLEDAIRLEWEIRGDDHIYLDSIRTDDGDVPNEDAHGLTGHLVTLTRMVLLLAEFDRDAARREVQRWASTDHVFTRLRIWAFERTDLTTPEEVGRGLLALDDESFWNSDHEMELLYALRSRWKQLPSPVIASLESRLRSGDIPWAREHEQRDELVAFYRLNRLHWLAEHGVSFSFDYNAEMTSLREAAPEWTEKSTRYTAQPHFSKVRSLTTDDDASSLERLPISEILQRAQAIGRHEFDSAVLRRPFSGLVENHPMRALAALKDATRRNSFHAWAWSTLLYSTAAKVRTPRMRRLIGSRLARLLPAWLREIVHPATDWLRENSNALLSDYPKVFDLVWDALQSALPGTSEMHKFAGTDRRWVDESLNSAAGRMMEALFRSPSLSDLKPDGGLPEAFSARLDQMLGLAADDRRYVIVMIASKLPWLYQTDPEWVDRQILPLSAGHSADTDAFWAGFLWAARVPQASLYLKLKQPLIALASHQSLRKEFANCLAGILLYGWVRRKDSAYSDPIISDVELREILIHAGDEFRAWIIWNVQQWIRNADLPLCENLLPFLEHVWPRQRTVRTAFLSGKLTDLALSAPDRFPDIVKAILPRLVPIHRHSTMLSRVDVDEIIFTRYPTILLDLLSVVLSADPTTWPYGTGEVLDRLAMQPEAKDDVRLATLQRYERRR
ncbi:SIR2 family protein [Caballeronia zhejiangensis]|uniref:SIR2 family protein n=1 Tax=Caballeronia zhejiangensis TaxID=871203 RepID=UPI00158A7409|nr:SIR2 family protein [Caballeronia zhejiangensis]MCG7403035.1 SIR2 family protein [Caballeronia zhejiangensis]MCI1043859.1 SIR2 family protein [Caballeronia zhejiangensis]